jgi:hypothetical protein
VLVQRELDNYYDHHNRLIDKRQTPKGRGQGNCLRTVYQRGMGLGSPTRNYALGVPFQPMNHRQDADATKPHGQDARATNVRNGYVQLPGGRGAEPLTSKQPVGRSAFLVVPSCGETGTEDCHV